MVPEIAKRLVESPRFAGLEFLRVDHIEPQSLFSLRFSWPVSHRYRNEFRLSRIAAGCPPELLTRTPPESWNGVLSPRPGTVQSAAGAQFADGLPVTPR